YLVDTIPNLLDDHAPFIPWLPLIPVPEFVILHRGNRNRWNYHRHLTVLASFERARAAIASIRSLQFLCTKPHCKHHWTRKTFNTDECPHGTPERHRAPTTLAHPEPRYCPCCHRCGYQPTTERKETTIRKERQEQQKNQKPKVTTQVFGSTVPTTSTPAPPIWIAGKPLKAATQNPSSDNPEPNFLVTGFLPIGTSLNLASSSTSTTPPKRWG
ncbi:hypothetical protein FS837_010459, partial [Tulasnella sp. UAMH 9824]